jgi:hypothetical protein
MDYCVPLACGIKLCMMLNLQSSVWLTPQGRCYTLSPNCVNLRIRICRLLFCIVLGSLLYNIPLLFDRIYTYFTSILDISNYLNIIDLVISFLIIERDRKCLL